MSGFKKLLISFSGNKLVQKILEYNVRKSHELMGIGVGTDVDNSGEIIIFKTLKRLIPQPYCIFDVGANKGQFLNLLLSNINKGSFHVHCFEPGSYTFKILSDNFRNNMNISLNNFGLGKEKGEFELFYDEPGSGIASLTRRRLDHLGIKFSKSEIVTIDTLDNYCLTKSIENIDLLKIDIEGHELDILKSGSNTMFKREAIKMVSFEFGGCNIDTRTFFKDFFYFFDDVNMSLYRITPAGYLYPILSYREIYEQFTTTNFLALNNKLAK